MAMRPQLHHLTVAMVTVVVTAWLAYNHGNNPQTSVAFGVSDVYEMVPVENCGAVGPESLAFDAHGEGPYAGVSDGRIIKWDRLENHWVDFAVTSSNSESINFDGKIILTAQLLMEEERKDEIEEEKIRVYTK
ncbi:hypothetical protein KIW84_032595 [Lathyrus oleraceus]|uniref:Uncharacterized protein n=1 Tax=Pisum sativum TaxID=3888 RepID=A0A9D4XZ01_PEA|nr:hypothetical protein KIW84_032595 [Pisum sativum]